MSAARDAALARLGIEAWHLAACPQITPQFRVIERTLRGSGIRRDPQQGDDPQHPSPYGPGADLSTAWPSYLQSAVEEEARRVLLAYHSIPKTMRRLLPIEAFCLAAGVPPMRILQIITGVCVSMGAAAAQIILAVNQPRLVQKSVERGLHDKGFADREMIAKITGLLPTPSGAKTVVQVTQTASANSNSDAQADANAKALTVAAPPPEATIRRAVDRWNDSASRAALTGSEMQDERRALPPTSAVELPDAVIEYEADGVLIDADSDV